MRFVDTLCVSLVFACLLGCRHPERPPDRAPLCGKGGYLRVKLTGEKAMVIEIHTWRGSWNNEALIYSYRCHVANAVVSDGGGFLATGADVQRCLAVVWFDECELDAWTEEKP